jgi:Ni/Fe-hydrogenase subunit HybB-like protein
VRGAFVIAGYTAVLVLHFIAAFMASGAALRLAAAPAGMLLAAATAVYTAYLFAQARGRDLWQSALLAPHLLVQAFVAGAAALLPVALVVDRAAAAPLAAVLAIAALLHLLFVLGEATLPHPTAHARLAAEEMTRGRYARFFWAGVALVAAGALAPWVGPVAAVAALAGLLCHEHAYVQAAQCVPIA